MTSFSTQTHLIMFGLCMVAGPARLARAEAPLVSTFAATDVLVAEISELVEKTKKSVATEKAYEAATVQVEKDAATLAALAVAVGLHDEDNPLKSAAPALLHAARKLAECENQADAKAALAAVEAAIASGAGERDEPSWDESAASIESLMKQVTFLNTQLRRGVRNGKVRRPESTVAQATVLAVLAQAVVCEGEQYASDDEQLAAWNDMAAEMRDAAVAMRDAAAAKDGAAAEAGKERLEKNCKACHEEFDIDEPE